MSVQEIQTAITQLPPDELADLLEWIESFEEQCWDAQIARDAKAGKFDSIRERVRDQSKNGECQPLA